MEDIIAWLGREDVLNTETAHPLINWRTKNMMCSRKDLEAILKPLLDEDAELSDFVTRILSLVPASAFPAATPATLRKKWVFNDHL